MIRHDDRHRTPAALASLKADEYPPVGLEVWTTDGNEVSRGQWFWDWEPPAPFKPLKDGVWKDMAGNVIQVTTWLPLEDSPERPPAAPVDSSVCGKAG